MEKRVLYNVVCIVMVILYVAVRCTFATDNNGTASKDVDGKFLLKLGRQLNKPMLTLIGMAVNNLQNRNQCGFWTQWSECGAIRAEYISTRKRTRKCRPKSVATDLENENEMAETDVSICEGKCPKDYNLTTNGFCVKLYVTVKAFDDAVKQCREDGGQLIDIDSELKYGDVKNIFKGFSDYLYIDGRRKDSTSPWLLGDGTQKVFFKWASGEPNNDSYLCMGMHPSTFNWYDRPCTSKYVYMCEMKL